MTISARLLATLATGSVIATSAIATSMAIADDGLETYRNRAIFSLVPLG